MNLADKIVARLREPGLPWSTKSGDAAIIALVEAADTARDGPDDQRLWIEGALDELAEALGIELPEPFRLAPPLGSTPATGEPLSPKQ